MILTLHTSSMVTRLFTSSSTLLSSLLIGIAFRNAFSSQTFMVGFIVGIVMWLPRHKFYSTKALSPTISKPHELLEVFPTNFNIIKTIVTLFLQSTSQWDIGHLDHTTCYPIRASVIHTFTHENSCYLLTSLHTVVLCLMLELKSFHSRCLCVVHPTHDVMRQAPHVIARFIIQLPSKDFNLHLSHHTQFHIKDTFIDQITT